MFEEMHAILGFVLFTKLQIIVFRLLPGFGCDTKAVVNILSHRDATQRALIQQEYKSMYGDELTKRLRSELSGDLEVHFCISSVLLIICGGNWIVTFSISESGSSMAT